MKYNNKIHIFITINCGTIRNGATLQLLLKNEKNILKKSDTQQRTEIAQLTSLAEHSYHEIEVIT